MRTFNNGNGKRILIADDSSTVRQLMRMVLEKQLGCSVIEARDGADAMERLRTDGSFDLIVTDINMPRMDGLAFIRAAREEIKATVPIVIITTRGAEDDRDKGLALGASSYITKPFDGAALARVVLSLMGNRED